MYKKVVQHIKSFVLSRYNWQLVIAFVAGAFIAALIMDFAPFDHMLENAAFTKRVGELLAQITALLVKIFGYDVIVHATAIEFSRGNGVYFAFGCLAFRQVIWFAVFIMLAPGPWLHKTWYIPAGIILIEFSNVLRAAVIAITNYHNPRMFDLIHVQGNIWYIYGTVLFLWIMWLQMINESSLTNRPAPPC